MSDHDRYPGLVNLERVEASVQALDAGPTAAGLIRLLDELHAAAVGGLPPGRWIDGTRVFFMAVQDTLDRVENLMDLPDALVTRVIEAAHADWLPQVPLLEPDAQANAWHLLDVLYANRVRSHQVESFVRDAESFLVGSPFPAVQTALQLVLRMTALGVQDSRVPWTLDFLDGNARDEATLVSVAALRHRMEIGFQAARARCTKSGLDGLMALWTLNEAVSETFGDDDAVTSPDSLDPRTRQQLKEAAGVLEQRVLEVSALLDKHDPFCEGLLEFVMGRLEAAAGNLVEAIRVFERLVARDFCLFNSAAYLARIWLQRGYPEEARKAIEGVAGQIPIVRGDPVGQFPLGELYLEAGGDPDSLALSEAPQRFVDRAQENRDTLAGRFHTGLDEARERAWSDFWETRERRLLAFLARQVKAADFDAVLGGANAGRTLRLGREVAATTCLDALPGIPEAVRLALSAATRAPVPVHEVMPHVLALLAGLEGRGHPFEELVRKFPGYGHSRGVAVARMQRELAAGRLDAASGLLDLYESLPDVSDALLAALFEEALEPLSRATDWLSTLRRGMRLWRRVRGEPGRRIGALCREAAFARLADDGTRATWPELARTVLDLMPDHDVQQRLWDWYAAHLVAAPPDDVKLEVGILLAERLVPPFQEWARTAVRDGIGLRLAALANLDGPGARRAVLQSLLDAAGNDAVVHRAIADWFAVAELPLEEHAALGEWLLPRLAGSDDGATVRAVTRERLMRMLTARARPDLEVGLIERLFALDPEDAALRTLLDEYRRARARFKWVLVGIGAATLTAIVLLAIFLR